LTEIKTIEEIIEFCYFLIPVIVLVIIIVQIIFELNYKEESKRSRKKLDKIIDLIKRYDESECVVCHGNFNACGCHYTLGDAYLEEIEKILET